jgi:hypothetical protein
VLVAQGTDPACPLLWGPACGACKPLSSSYTDRVVKALPGDYVCLNRLVSPALQKAGERCEANPALSSLPVCRLLHSGAYGRGQRGSSAITSGIGKESDRGDGAASAGLSGRGTPVRVHPLYVAQVDGDCCVDWGFCRSIAYCPSPRDCVGCAVCVAACPCQARELVPDETVRAAIDLAIDGRPCCVPERITVKRPLELIGLSFGKAWAEGDLPAPCGTGGSCN